MILGIFQTRYYLMNNILKKQFINWKNILLISLLTIVTTGCSEFAILMSGSSLALTQNTYAKVYNAADMLTIMGTEKSIKEQVYEKGKKYIVDWTKAKSLGITTQH